MVWLALVLSENACSSAVIVLPHLLAIPFFGLGAMTLLGNGCHVLVYGRHITDMVGTYFATKYAPEIGTVWVALLSSNIYR